MSTVIQKAVKGQRNAMELLYETNKQKVFYVSLLLLGNEVEASRAASYAFKNVWGSMTALRHYDGGRLYSSGDPCGSRLLQKKGGKDLSQGLSHPERPEFSDVRSHNAP